MTVIEQTCMQMAPLLVRAGQTRIAAYDFLGAGVSGTCLIGAEQTNGTFSAFEVTVEPGAGVPPHIHSREDETFYVLEGRFQVQRGDRWIEMGAGMALHGPRGLAHGFRCSGETRGRLLVVTTPGGFEKFFAELDAAAIDLQAPGEAAFVRVGALMQKYGMEAAEPASPTIPGHLSPGSFFGLGNHRGHVLVAPDETGGALALGVMEVDPQGGPQPHLHRQEDEAYYILEGRFALRMDDEVTEAGPGDFFFAPRSVPHSWKNISDAPAYFTAFVTPGANFAAFAREMERFLMGIGDDLSVLSANPLLRKEMGEIYRRYDIEPILPTGAIK